MIASYKIGVIGLWHLGEIYSAGLAELGHSVIGIDEDEEVIRNLENSIPPLAEPQLAELLRSNRSAGRLLYSSNFSKIKECNVVWVTFDTPVNDDDEVQLDVIFKSLEQIIAYLQDGVLFVVSSQIPIGTSKKVVAMIKEKCPEITFYYAYSPENLRLGEAVKCFMDPGRIVIGTEDDEALTKMKEIFSPLHVEIVVMNPASAEMTKHALNAFLATSISFTNDIADLCELYGADVEEVIRALKSDPRIGPKAYLFAGLGFSGGTLGRDLKAMMIAGKARDIKLPVIEGVFLKNKSRKTIVEQKLTKEFGDIKGRTLALFGVTYKAGTSTLRRSQPLEIEKLLREAGAILKLYDSFAKIDEVAAITPSSFSDDPYEAVKDAEAILIMTPSKDFLNLDFPRLRTAMAGSLLFDTCNILWDKRDEIRSAGFKYICVGQ
ncbi:MAG: nucleotide sugar dehydrogenase [bacterium]|nr:nucleotide sugar dehydrogenase [bacterium]